MKPGDVWWSLRPLRQVAIPSFQHSTLDVQRSTPIDSFILAKLREKGLRPNPPADRRTLIRRVTYDLIGLPPTPDEMDTFLKDRSPNAYEKVIDRLLASPRYGERWGRHWLDIVHYADTHGYDKDKRRDHAWPYRDYVIRSLNEDKSYSRCIKEQIAGDILFPNSPDGIIATGFIAAGPWDFVGHVELVEGTVEKAKTRNLDRDDMVMNAMSTFNSVTIHCARCHDHKFDPIPQRDYYSLQAVFAGVERGDRPYEDLPNAKKRSDAEARAKASSDRLAELKKKAARVTSPELTKLDDEFALAKQRWTTMSIPGGQPSPTNGYHSEIAASPDVTKWVQLDLGRSTPIDTVRLIPARPTDFLDTPGFGFPVRFKIEFSDDPDFKRSTTVADRSNFDYRNPGLVPVTIGVTRGSGRYVRITANKLWRRTNDYVFALAELEVISAGKSISKDASITALDSIEAGRWSRKYLVDGFDSRTRLPDFSSRPTAEQIQAQMAIEMQIYGLETRRQSIVESLIDPAIRDDMAAASMEIDAAEAALKTLPPPNLVYTLIPHEPRPIHVLNRGEIEQPGPVAQPGALSCISGIAWQSNPTVTSEPSFVAFTGSTTDKIPAKDEGQARASLAGWISSPNNPLTWRSIVNRVWQYHFGRGLVDTPSDFGRNGSLPSHPELLDWLAYEFRHDQSLKHLHRLVVLSAAYRQSSWNDPACARLDSDNRLLWRMNRQRLDAEEIRDSILAVSGKLDLTMGGPGVELFRFKDDHSPIYDHSAVEKINDPTAWRRTVYRFTVRSVSNPLLECLDCADPNINTPVRNTTLTALQALAMLNDPFVVDQAEHFARRIIKLAEDRRKQLDMAYRFAFGRPPKPSELNAMSAYADRHGLSNVCRLLFNSNEFIFLD